MNNIPHTGLTKIFFPGWSFYTVQAWVWCGLCIAPGIQLAELAWGLSYNMKHDHSRFYIRLRSLTQQ